ncbi:hypothetical protein ACQY0O_001327 [Thecaphora frezii]
MAATLTLQDILSDLSLLSSASGAHAMLAAHLDASTSASVSEAQRFIDQAHDSIRLNTELVSLSQSDQDGQDDDLDRVPASRGGAPARKRGTERASRTDYLHAKVARLQTGAEAWTAGLESALQELNGRGGEIEAGEVVDKRKVQASPATDETAVAQKEEQQQQAAPYQQAAPLEVDDETVEDDDPWDLT